MDSAARNIMGQVSDIICSCLLDVHPVVGVLDRMTDLFLILKRRFHTASHNGCFNYIVPIVRETPPFSTLSPSFVTVCLLDSSHPDRKELISHCGFDLHFSDD